MAPVDRHERRQQRVRGAGATGVQANFGFNLAAFAPKAKQASAPPQSSRRTRTPTPSRRTPGSSKISAKSAKRFRSVSVHRSGSVRRSTTPKIRTVTPQTGKRKRGSKHALPAADDGEVDDLSPEHEKRFPSVENGRKVAASVTPIREEADDVPDELSILEEETGSARKIADNGSVISTGTPAPVSGAASRTPKSVPEKTPIADRVGNMSISLRQSIVRRSKSTELQVTPKTLPNGRPRVSSASHFDESFNTPGANPDEEDSEDELTPRPNREETPRSVVSITPAGPAPEEEGEIDELSSPAQPIQTPKAQNSAKQKPVESPAEEQEDAAPVRRRGRPKRVITDEEEDEVQATPAKTSQPLRKKRTSNLSIEERAYPDDEDNIPDEISPEANRVKQLPPPRNLPNKMMKKPDPNPPTIDISSAEESHTYDPDEHASEEEETQEPTRPTSNPKPPPSKRQKTQPNTTTTSGPKYTVSVMRLKPPSSSTTSTTKPRNVLPPISARGISVADTTHTLITQTTTAYISRLASKLSSLPPPSSSTPPTTLATTKKHLRTRINHTLAFTESLREKLLDLQDANDVLTSVSKSRRVLHAGNRALRRTFLEVQREREDVALLTDRAQDAFEGTKGKIERKKVLSEYLEGIEGAVRRGREEARRRGRDAEGADGEADVGAWVVRVGREVAGGGGGGEGGKGGGGGGLLERLKGFNEGLERAAMWLEGRA
ncbi:hypothetical protein DM02DRAFT_596805 [Periconia macrospinosa]|uniref:AT hook domain-containing protein n=1 Tax=Periconia macrospinosa TaxID=97972 RepID=A0A2V1DIA0_9PLEO|nr:hypothetical protein DM02DRAFT_596805 [Periconia macrospinosa]